MDLWIRGGTVVAPDGVATRDLFVSDGRFCEAAPEGATVIDAAGKLVFPGLIDTQVHFREPGLTHKEDLASGSLAAVAGGVTTFFEMPNTKPATTTPDALEDKLQRAAGRAWADHAFFIGATAENADRLDDWEHLPGCCGVKIFMGSSTGSLLVDDAAVVERILRGGQRPVAVHAEDEARLRERYAAVEVGSPYNIHPEVRDPQAALIATTRLLDLAEKTGRRVHVLHISTADEIALLRARDLKGLVTAEATPNHLFLEAPDCYNRFGSRAQMNPPVRDAHHRDAIRQGVVDGVITCIGSDHAPHTLEEKDKPYPTCPSGIPGVQTTLGLMLTAVRDGWLSLQDVARLTAAAPAAIYEIRNKGAIAAGHDADLTIVDPEITQPLPEQWLRSRAGYSPFCGVELAGWPVVTILRGEVVYRDHEPVGDPIGAPVAVG
ncbi:MAG: dihydroorotase [Planctomycetota bacterium]|nr:dihydroorotase [Planctomycetota bacterium]